MALISVSGTQCIGKSTFIEDFILNWPMFKAPEKTYRDIIKDKGLKINQETTKESQKLILDSIIEIMESYPRKENIIFDRSPLDNIVYSIWAYEKNKGNIDSEFVTECIQKSRQALQRLDIMFLIPISKQNDINLEEKEQRDIDPEYRTEIDELFQGLKRHKEAGDNVFFVKDDSPPIIEIFGSRQERIEIAKLYLKDDGSFYGEEESLLFDAQGDAIGQNSSDIIDTGEREQLRKYLDLK